MQQLILIVEDDDANREVIQEILTDSGYRVRAVPTAAEARDEALRERPALLILDGAPPDDRRIAAALAAEIPSVVVSARSYIDRDATAVGAREWLRKPYDMDELLAVVRRQVSAGATERRER